MIIRVTAEEAIRIVVEWQNSNGTANRNRYITNDNGKIVAIDNTDGDCWVEEFDTIEAAEEWLGN